MKTESLPPRTFLPGGGTPARGQLTVTAPRGQCYVRKSQVAVEAQRRVSAPSGRMLSGGDISAGKGENWRRGVPRIRTCAEPCREEHCRLSELPAAQPSRRAGREEGRGEEVRQPSRAGVQDGKRGVVKRSAGTGCAGRGTACL